MTSIIGTAVRIPAAYRGMRAGRAPEHIVRRNLKGALSEARKHGDGETEREIRDALGETGELGPDG